MYDWPERRDDVDAEWVVIRDRLRGAGIDAPDELMRGLEEQDLWRHPDLLFTQTCWGPMERGLAGHVQVVGQPSYDGIEGGAGPLYSSAIVVRGTGEAVPSGHGVDAEIPLDLLRNRRLAFNSPDSMSGLIGLTRDLEALNENLDIFSALVETGSHRDSIKAVAGGRADVAAIDCMSWHLARLHEPAASNVQVVGWTAKRMGLPFITAASTPTDLVGALSAAITGQISLTSAG